MDRPGRCPARADPAVRYDGMAITSFKPNAEMLNYRSHNRSGSLRRRWNISRMILFKPPIALAETDDVRRGCSTSCRVASTLAVRD